MAAPTPKLSVLPSSALPWVDGQGRPTTQMIQFMTAIAASNIGPLTSAANDAAAAKAGVPVNGLYQSSGAVKIRLT
jgi:hypothetical protein